jgi:hypothetical protein
MAVLSGRVQRLVGRALSRAAVRPAARRTPLASYRMTKERAAARAKRGDWKPSLQLIAAVVPVIRAEWLEGMPPVSNSTAGRQRPWRTSSTASLESWASPQAARPHQSTALSARSRSIKRAWPESEAAGRLIDRGW